jgi:hypothetical protein
MAYLFLYEGMVVKIHSNILIVSLILVVICLVGCKRKTEPAPSGAGKAEGKSSVGAGLVPAQNDNVVQPIKVEINKIEPNITATPEPEEIVAAVNGVKILKSDYEARVEQKGKKRKRGSGVFFLKAIQKQPCKSNVNPCQRKIKFLFFPYEWLAPQLYWGVLLWPGSIKSLLFLIS